MKKKTILEGRYSVAILIAITAVVCVAFFIMGIRRMQNVYSEQMYANELETREQVLSDTVNNLIGEIDLKQQEYDALYTEYMADAQIQAQDYAVASGNYADGLATYFDDLSMADCFSYLIVDSSTNTILNTAGALAGVEDVGNVSDLTDTLAYSSMLKNGTITCIYGISKDYLYTLCYNEIAGIIKQQSYSSGEYVWITRIDDYEGGDDFATVLVHPGYTDLEGTKISTNTVDEQDNAYNQVMLDGILSDGELYYSYWYREYQSDLVSKKIVFSKLYEDYDWVISMGIPAHAIVEFVSDTESENQPVITRMIVIISIMFVLIFALCMYFIIGNDRKFFMLREARLRNDAEVDELTKASTRKHGNHLMEEQFRRFKETGHSPAIMILDVDKFKTINDNYGHDAGDEVLKKVVRVLKKNMRGTDALIRWGGDEFVGIFTGVNMKNLHTLADKMMQSVTDLEILSNGEIIKVTVSIGFTFFHKEDKNYADAVKRADDGLYKSKTGGRNQFNIAE